MKISTQAQKTLDRLNEKTEVMSKTRMPSIKKISELLTEVGLYHYTNETVNVVEYRNAGNRYVNSRHDGKKGTQLTLKANGKYINMDTSDSYYSYNTWGYARDLVAVIEQEIQEQTQ